jgi:hypothetical protein
VTSSFRARSACWASAAYQSTFLGRWAPMAASNGW